MPDIINSNFDPRLPFPLDVRQQVQNMNALFMIPQTSRWEGMIVYVRSAELPYILRGGTDNTFWEPFQFNGGGGLLPNGIVVYGEAQQSGNDVLLNDGWVWRINQVDYQSSDDTIAITPAASGNLRIDIIVGNTSGEFVKVVGTEVESPGPAIEPNIPADTVPLVRVDVNDTGIVAIEEFILSAFVRYDINDQNLNPSHRQNARTNIQAVSKDTDDTRTGGLTNEGKVTVDLDEASAALPIVEIKQQGVTKHVFTGDEARIIPHLLRVNSPISPTVRGASFRGSTNGGDPIFEIQNAGGTKIFYPRGTGGIGQLRSNASDTSIRRDENFLTFPATITGTGKLNDVALADGVGMIQFGADVTIVSGIDPNGDQKELIIWSDNVNGLTITAEDTDSIAANRFLREINVPYRVPIKLIYKGTINRWVQTGGIGLEEQPFNPDQFEIDPITDEFQIIDGLLGGDANKLVPGYNDTLEQTEDTIDVPFRRLIARNGVFFGCSSTGDNNRLYVSMDGRTFIKAGTTGSIAAYALDVAPHGTIIVVDRTSGTTNIKRSTDGGATFADATIATAYEVTGVKYIGGGRWVGSCRTGTGNRAIYSTDDGLNWSSATTSEDNPYEDIGFGGGYVFMVAGTGTNRVQISTDNGETYTGSAPAQNQFWGKCLFFKGSIVLVRVGAGIFGIGGYVTHSADGGTTWTESLPADDGAQQLIDASVIGDWLYLYGNDGYVIRSKDLVTKEIVYAANELTTNEISGMSETVINGYSTIMAVCSTGTNDRVFSNIIYPS